MNRFSTTTTVACLACLPAAALAQAQQQEVIRLPDIVVTAAGFEQTRAAAPASITVLTARELRERRATNLAEVLLTVEGIDVGATAGKTGGLNVSMRGMPADYTLILIDGRRQNAAGNVTPNGFGETSTSFIPPLSAIERVEVIRGPVATLYGSDAMGGVINIITRKVAPSWSGTVTTDATLQEREGFGNAYSVSGAVHGPVVGDVVGLSLRGSFLHRAAANLRPTGEFGEGTVISRRGASPVRANNHSLGGRLSFSLSAAHDVALDVESARQRYDNAEGQLGTLDRPDGSPPSFNGYGPELQFIREQAALSHEWRLGGAVLSSSLMRNATETKGRTIPPGTPGGLPGSGAPNKEPGSPRALESVNTVFDSKLTSSLRRHVFSAGVQVWDAEMIDGVALEPFSFTQWAVFAEDEFRVTPAVALTLGLRRDDHSSFGGQISPRAYLVWNATSAWTFKGGVSRGYRTPRVEQLAEGITGFTGQGRNAVIGSPHLRPETSTTTELSAHVAPRSGASLGVTFFNNQFRDKIATGTPVPNCTFALAPDRPGCVSHGDFPSQEYFSQSVNVDRARTWGAELSGRMPLSDAVVVSGNYTWTRSEQQSGENRGMPLTNTPEHSVNGEVRASLTDRLTTWARGEYRSERARRLSVAADPAWEALGDFRAYGLIHMGGGWEIRPGVMLNATVHNVLNRDFLEYGSYQGTPTAENPSGIMYTSLYNNMQEGRRLWLSTTVQF